jgi:integrase
LISPNGAKRWQMRYRDIVGKEQTLTIGPYPEVSLSDARQKRLDVRRMLVEGADPNVDKKERKQAEIQRVSNMFEKIAREWHANKLPTWSESTARDNLRRLEIDIFPEIGAMPIDAITHQHMIAALRKIEARGAHEIAHRVEANCARVFSYANQLGIENRNPASDLKDVLKPVKAGHFKAINAEELPEFLQQMNSPEHRMYPETRIAMKLMLLLFPRTSELIETPWSEIDLEKGEWIIPWRRMKRASLR